MSSLEFSRTIISLLRKSVSPVLKVLSAPDGQKRLRIKASLDEFSATKKLLPDMVGAFVFLDLLKT